MSDTTVIAATPDSVLAGLRANRERLLADRSKTLRLPGWDSLHVEYKRLPWERVRVLSSLGDEFADSTEQIGSAIDILVAACQRVLFQNEDGTKQDLGVRFDQALAKLIGDEEATAPPEVVLSVFADDELTLMTHVGQYMAWATRQEDEADQKLGKDSLKTNE